MHIIIIIIIKVIIYEDEKLKWILQIFFPFKVCLLKFDCNWFNTFWVLEFFYFDIFFNVTNKLLRYVFSAWRTTTSVISSFPIIALFFDSLKNVILVYCLAPAFYLTSLLFKQSSSISLDLQSFL